MNNRPAQQKTFPIFNVVQPQMYAQMPIPQMAQVLNGLNRIDFSRSQKVDAVYPFG